MVDPSVVIAYARAAWLTLKLIMWRPTLNLPKRTPEAGFSTAAIAAQVTFQLSYKWSFAIAKVDLRCSSLASQNTIDM